jgi:hypothetical protein
MTTDGSLDWMGGFTRNDPTALDKPCFFFPSTSISFVVIGLRLSFFLSFFLSFSFLLTSKIPYLLLCLKYITHLCVCVYVYIYCRWHFVVVVVVVVVVLDKRGKRGKRERMRE